MSSPQTMRDRLAARMKEARVATGLSGSAFATKLGWGQPRVSKIETGAQLPTREDVAAWATAAELTQAATDELLELARYAYVEYETWRAAYSRDGGAAQKQTAIGERERKARVVSQFCLGMLPGLVQTPAYARDALSIPGGPLAWGSIEADIERIVAARIERQAILYDTGRVYRVVLPESALRTRFGTVETLREQLDRLTVVAGLASVDLRVIPSGAQWPVFPLATFKLFDDEMVLLEQPVGEQLIIDPEQVKIYTTFFELLQGAALDSAASVNLIRQVAAQV